MRERFSQEDANEILRRAIEIQPAGREVTREQLESLAAEVGVSTEALRAAEERWSVENLARTSQDDEDRHAFRAMRQARKRVVTGFVVHLCIFVWFAFIFSMIALEEDDFIPIALAFLVPWSIAVLVHGSRTFFGSIDDEEMAFRRWQRERRERLDAGRDAPSHRLMR